ncbi:Aste57867_10105 [Aphanomyces stellatus]|uniref:Aste57867_10105 protein n=1 Tax=Aphanomyces stellatus TaxID=120398 RepID=A0A485KPZ0_9STRA|nr:hypothetical protein As57867_010066 [Aphanomyces stellatus]VFT86981.1 Aste57867_10105 [Aphanomyces stellatus]
MATPLPFFVYGTLMKGFRNFERHVKPYRSLRVVSSRGVVANASLVHFPMGYPGMYPGTGVVVGEVVTVDDPAEYSAFLLGLDELEEFFGPNDPSNEYDRVEIDVACDDGAIVRAWAYFCKIPRETAVAAVADGDWRAYMATHDLQDIHADKDDGVHHDH